MQARGLGKCCIRFNWLHGRSADPDVAARAGENDKALQRAACPGRVLRAIGEAGWSEGKRAQGMAGVAWRANSLERGGEGVYSGLNVPATDSARGNSGALL
jgi:hypothetical protein